MNYIAADFKHGKNLEIGYYCVIHGNVIVGDNVTIKSYVELRPGTVIGDNCYIDSGVRSSGKNWIGDSVTLRYGAIIARGCVIEDWCYICPQVMTNNVDHHGNQIGGAKIGRYCFVGTNATLGAGIEIVHDTVIGAKALVLKDILEPGGTWVGIPAKRIK